MVGRAVYRPPGGVTPPGRYRAARCSAIQASPTVQKSPVVAICRPGCLWLPPGEPVLRAFRRQAVAEEPVPYRQAAGLIYPLGIRSTGHRNRVAPRR